MKFVYIVTKEKEIQYLQYYFIYATCSSLELAKKIINERVDAHGGDIDDYEIIRMPLIGGIVQCGEE